MFEYTERELTPNEQELLNRKIILRRKQKNFALRRSFVSGLIVSAILSGLVLLASTAPRHIVLMFFLGTWLSLFLWVGMTEKKKLSKAVAELEGALARNRASVVRIASQKVVEFEEIEDEGACYAFQLPQNKIVFVSGQDFYPSAKFPNTDFEIVTVFDSRGLALDGWTVKNDKHLTPVRKIPSDVKKTLRPPEHLAVIDGNLDNLETLLRRTA
jgi:hypothetical protein